MSRDRCVHLDTVGSDVAETGETSRVEADAEQARRVSECIARAMIRSLARDLVLEQYVLLVPEAKSPLGKIAHVAAVQKRLRYGEPGACVLDGKYLLTEPALAEEQELARRGMGGEGRA